jgi:hypothetical protein
MNADGSNVGASHVLGELQPEPSWSPDGRWIVWRFEEKPRPRPVLVRARVALVSDWSAYAPLPKRCDPWTSGTGSR